MGHLGSHLECTFGNFLTSVLVDVYAVNNVDLSNEKIFEDGGCESELNKQKILCLEPSLSCRAILRYVSLAKLQALVMVAYGLLICLSVRKRWLGCGYK